MLGEEKKSSRKNIDFFFGPNRVINPLVHGFEKMIFFISQKKYLRKKIRTTGGCSPPGGGTAGGCSPPGGLQGGVGRGKKSSEKISKKKFGPNRPIIPLVHGFEKMIFFISQKIFLRKKISALHGGCSPPGGGTAGGVVPQGGLQGGVVPFILGEKP